MGKKWSFKKLYIKTKKAKNLAYKLMPKVVGVWVKLISTFFFLNFMYSFVKSYFSKYK